MYQVEIGNHLNLEVVPSMDEGEPPIIWIRDSVNCDKCHTSMLLRPSEIDPLLSELADIASASAKTATSELREAKRRIANRLEIEIIDKKRSDYLGFEVAAEEFPIIVVYDGSVSSGNKPCAITLRLADITPLRGALEKISGYTRANDAVLLYNEGTDAMHRGNHKRAIACFREAILLDPQDNRPVFNLAVCYDLLGQLDDAMLWYQRALDLDPSDPDPLHSMAEIYFRKRELPQANKLCRQSLNLFQKQFENAQFTPLPPQEPLSREELLADIAHRSAVTYHLMALIEVNGGRPQEALESIQTALKIHPRKAKWWLQMAQIHHRLDNDIEAQDALRRARELDPDVATGEFGRDGTGLPLQSQEIAKVEKHFTRGTDYLRRGDLDEAIREFQAALRVAPDYAKAHSNLGVAYGKQGRLDEAIREFQAALHINPDYAEAHSGLGVIYEQQGRLDEAIREHEAALLIAPDFAEAHYNLGVAYGKQGRLDEAIREFQAALHINADYAEAHYNLGVAYEQQGRLDEAIREFQAALHINPDYAEAHYNLGVIHGQQGHLDEAIREYQAALRSNPDYADAHYNLGVVHGQQGRLDEAVREYQATLRINPDYIDVHIDLGVVYGQQGRLDEAIREFQAALRVAPDFAEAHYNLGVAYGKQGRLDEAVRELRVTVRLDPGMAEAHVGLGQVYWLKNRHSEAIQELRLAAQLGSQQAQTLLAEMGL